MLYIGNAWKGKTPRTWHHWNIKIPKPPCISSPKINGLLCFWKFLGLSEENYNLQSLWITLYSGCSWQKLRKLELNQEHIWLNFCVYKIQPRIEKSHKNYKWNHQRISENTTNLRICSKKTLHFLCLCIMVHTKKLIMIMQTYICVVWFAWITQFDLIFVICWRHIYLLLRCVHCAHMCPEGVLNWKKTPIFFVDAK